MNLGKPRREQPSTPVLFTSDKQWGEVVSLADMGGLNEYNLEIAEARIAG